MKMVSPLFKAIYNISVSYDTSASGVWNICLLYTSRVHLNIKYCDENLKTVYHELFDQAVERYNEGKRNDRKITDYYEKIRQGKQEKLFHEVIFQIGNSKDMAVGTEEGELAVKVLDEYMKDFQKRNPALRVFNCYLHLDEATPHLHIDFVPYVSNWKGKGMDTRVSLKQAMKSLSLIHIFRNIPYFPYVGSSSLIAIIRYFITNFFLTFPSK